MSADAPSCNLVYKLVEVVREDKIQPKMKASQGKATLPYRKHILRRINEGIFSGDQICTDTELPAESTDESLSLLQNYMQNGRLVCELPEEAQIREYSGEQLRRLPARFKLLHAETPYSVEYSPRLRQIQKELGKEFPLMSSQANQDDA